MARFVFVSALALAALLSLGSFNSMQGAGVVITLEPNIKYQTISGWEATAEVGQNDSAAFPKYKDQLYDLAVNDLGINRLRVEIKSGAENPTDYFAQYQNPATRPSEAEMRKHVYEIINDNADPNVINPDGFHFSELDSEMENIVLPMKQRLQARGEKLLINLNYIDFGSSPFEHKDHPEEYAEFVLSTYQHLQNKYGIVPDAWEVI
ncbi:MAG TPA: hypothetical protein VFD70_21665, partial [Anaerolineae bacterium]|nr:hypothetical protein [Anaerolineae bacterium]